MGMAQMMFTHPFEFWRLCTGLRANEVFSGALVAMTQPPPTHTHPQTYTHFQRRTVTVYITFISNFTVELIRLTEEMVEANGVALEEALVIVAQSIPENAVLVSYNIDSDLEWLRLEHKVNRGVSCLHLR